MGSDAQLSVEESYGEVFRVMSGAGIFTGERRFFTAGYIFTVEMYGECSKGDVVVRNECPARHARIQVSTCSGCDLYINCLCCCLACYSFVIHFSCISFFILIFFFFFLFAVMLYYSYTQTFSLSLLYCCHSYCVSFCALLDGVCLSKNKRITYLFTYLSQHQQLN